MKKVSEGKVSFFAPIEKVISAAMPVFYNPIMHTNRDIAVALLTAIGRKGMFIADPLAGSGVRSLRFLKELPRGTIKTLYANDGNPKFPLLFKKQLKLNNIPAKNVIVSQKDASGFLLEHNGFDYIEIDPFGSPNQFLDAACKRLSRDGILAVTATDTGALAGSFPDACRRKYWAEPLRNELMHEIGVRILIRKVQLIGMQYDKALIPLFSHATDHYDRIYLQSEKSKSYVQRICAQHGYVLYCERCMSHSVSKHNLAVCCKQNMRAAGPLWLGALWNHALVTKMKPHTEGQTRKLLDIIHGESHLAIVGFTDIHKLCKHLKCVVPKFDTIIMALKKKGYVAARTHFCDTGLRTDAPIDVVKKLLKN